MRKLIFPLVAVAITSCQNAPQSNSAETGSPAPPDTLRLALDWRPNVLHSGIFWAQAEGFYAEENIHLQWFSPEVDHYQKKPLWRVLQGEADVALGPSEHLFAFAADSLTGQVRAEAVATLLQNARSAFVCKATAQMKTPSQAAHAPYWGYHTPLEEQIWSAMIAHSGAQPDYETRNPGRLSVWQSFLNDSAGVAWVFLHWEALQARRAGVELHHFLPADYGVPYGYSSVLMAPTPRDSAAEDRLRRFLRATARGYRAVEQKDPMRVARRLANFIDHRNFDDTAFIAAAQANINPHYLKPDGRWGQMDSSRWKTYAAWLQAQNLSWTDSSLMAHPQVFYRNIRHR